MKNKKNTKIEISKNKGRTFVGKVVSSKMQKTVVIQIERKIQHSLYKKMIRKTKRLKADTAGFDLKPEDVVKIKETKPISRNKHFVVVQKIEGGKS